MLGCSAPEISLDENFILIFLWYKYLVMTSWLSLQASAWITSFPFQVGQGHAKCALGQPPRKRGLRVQFGKLCWKSICWNNLCGGAATSSNMLSYTRVHLLTLEVLPLWPKWALTEVMPKGLAIISKWGISRTASRECWLLFNLKTYMNSVKKNAWQGCWKCQAERRRKETENLKTKFLKSTSALNKNKACDSLNLLVVVVLENVEQRKERLNLPPYQEAFWYWHFFGTAS